MKILSKLMLLSILAGCVSANNNAGYSGIYGNVIDPVAIGSAAPKKTGKACSMSILHVIAYGDSSIETAMKDGGITKIATVDVDKKSHFVFAESCTIVKGE